MRHRLWEAALCMHLCRKPTWGDKLIDVSTCPSKQSHIAPNLRWTLRAKCTSKALRFFARTVIKLPKYVSGTDEPVLMRSVYFNNGSFLRLKGQDLRTEQ